MGHSGPESGVNITEDRLGVSFAFRISFGKYCIVRNCPPNPLHGGPSVSAGIGIRILFRAGQIDGDDVVGVRRSGVQAEDLAFFSDRPTPTAVPADPAFERG